MVIYAAQLIHVRFRSAHAHAHPPSSGSSERCHVHSSRRAPALRVALPAAGAHTHEANAWPAGRALIGAAEPTDHVV
jgi:hypothetical protein